MNRGQLITYKSQSAVQTTPTSSGGELGAFASGVANSPHLVDAAYDRVGNFAKNQVINYAGSSATKLANGIKTPGWSAIRNVYQTTSTIVEDGGPEDASALETAGLLLTLLLL